MRKHFSPELVICLICAIVVLACAGFFTYTASLPKVKYDLLQISTYEASSSYKVYSEPDGTYDNRGNYECLHYCDHTRDVAYTITFTKVDPNILKNYPDSIATVVVGKGVKKGGDMPTLVARYTNAKNALSALADYDLSETNYFLVGWDTNIVSSAIVTNGVNAALWKWCGDFGTKETPCFVW